METYKRTNKTAWAWIAIVSLLASTLGFTLSSQDDTDRFNEMGLMAQNHFTYALQLKDDMAFIDWSKALEKTPSVLAFRVTSDSKTLAEGGNKDYCPVKATDGLHFEFPYHWIFRSSIQRPNSTPAELTLVFQDFRGPIFWALCFFFLPVVMGWLLLATMHAKDAVSLPVPIVAETPKPKPIVKTPIATSDLKSLTMTLDKNYVIEQITPLAAKALGREVADLVGGHLLDLFPDPSLMTAIEAGQETKLVKPFPSHPRLSALLRPTLDGSTLVFEPGSGAEGA